MVDCIKLYIYKDSRLFETYFYLFRVIFKKVEILRIIKKRLTFARDFIANINALLRTHLITIYESVGQHYKPFFQSKLERLPKKGRWRDGRQDDYEHSNREKYRSKEMF